MYDSIDDFGGSKYPTSQMSRSVVITEIVFSCTSGQEKRQFRLTFRSVVITVLAVSQECVKIVVPISSRLCTLRILAYCVPPVYRRVCTLQWTVLSETRIHIIIWIRLITVTIRFSCRWRILLSCVNYRFLIENNLCERCQTRTIVYMASKQCSLKKGCRTLKWPQSVEWNTVLFKHCVTLPTASTIVIERHRASDSCGNRQLRNEPWKTNSRGLWLLLDFVFAIVGMWDLVLPFVNLGWIVCRVYHLREKPLDRETRVYKFRIRKAGGRVENDAGWTKSAVIFLQSSVLWAFIRISGVSDYQKGRGVWSYMTFTDWNCRGARNGRMYSCHRPLVSWFEIISTS